MMSKVGQVNRPVWNIVENHPAKFSTTKLTYELFATKSDIIDCAWIGGTLENTLIIFSVHPGRFNFVLPGNDSSSNSICNVLSFDIIASKSDGGVGGKACACFGGMV